MKVLVATYKNPNHSIGFGRGDMFSILDSIKESGHELYYHYISRFSTHATKMVLNDYLDGDESRYSDTLMRNQIKPKLESYDKIPTRKLANKILSMSTMDYLLDGQAIDDICKVIKEQGIELLVLAGLPFASYVKEQCPDVKVLYWSFDPIGISCLTQLTPEEVEEAQPLIKELETLIYSKADSISVACVLDKEYLNSQGFNSWVRVYNWESDIDASPSLRSYLPLENPITTVFTVGAKWYRNVPNLQKFVELLKQSPLYKGIAVSPYTKEDWFTESIEGLDVSCRSKVKNLAAVMNQAQIIFIAQDYHSGYCTKLAHALQTGTPAVCTKSALESIKLPDEYGINFESARESVILIEDENQTAEEIHEVLKKYTLADINRMSQNALNYTSQLTRDKCVALNKERMFN
ncbi:hypothetical protein CEW46_24680 [Bacillus cereus]|nr:hypothetical protein CEW46_24680 [Bacillus cereus]